MIILLVEDDASLQRGLLRALEDMGHQAVPASDGEHADTLLSAEPFDLVVLDLGLPKLDGLEVLRRLRNRRKSTPVLVLSARDRTQDRVHGLNSGADDYLNKPFDLSEFEARVRALLRRGQGAQTRVGMLDWSWESRQASIAGEPLVLSAKEISLLETLLQQVDRVISKETLSHRLGDVDMAAGDNTVEVYIHRMRRKLASAGLEIITVRGVGYLLRETADAR
ncbi:response regulator transcription factor [Chitinimonas sp.]|uniref:response regulator transcription factor n=1 Tax=Chitinimonas sp. TaxID=1934313 RepID=UPI0035B18D55